ncbi:MAG: hypothetical protein JXA49_03480 [Actinobacteria bacterium]|nr:hypothetical protein [Actinomycetota bacterium]
MPYDRQLEDKFRFFNARIIELEKASEAHDRAIEQIAEKLGVEIDLTFSSEKEREECGTEDKDDSLDQREIMALLKESQREDDEGCS